MLNEGLPAMVQNFTVRYDFDGSLLTLDWVQVDSFSVIDFGDGTYNISFTGDTAPNSSSVIVSLLCHDKRGILIGANATCNAG
jgi:phenolic acid decarboxylase